VDNEGLITLDDVLVVVLNTVVFLTLLFESYKRLTLVLFKYF